MKPFFVLMSCMLGLSANGQMVETVLTNPSVTDGMCTDSLGNVYTTSGGLAGYVVGRYSPVSDEFDPNFIAGLVGPTDVEFLNDSVICITNYDIDAISTYNLNTGILTTVATGLDGPGGIETDGNGFIYVTNWGNAPLYAGHTLTRISPSGSSWTYIDTSVLYRPQAITWNHENQLVIHSNSKLYKINEADSSLVHWADLPSGVANIVLNKSDSCIYGAANQAHQILKITPDGTVSVFAGSALGYVDGDISIAQFNTSLGLTFSPDENILYVAEANPHRLRRILLQSFTNVEEISFQGESNVYPNPLKIGESLKVENAKNKLLDQIVISDVNGRILYVHLSNSNNEFIPASVFENINGGFIIVKILFTDNSFEYHKIYINE